MSVMIGGVTDRIAPDSNFMVWDDATNSSIVDVIARDAERVRIAAAVTFLSGLFQVKSIEYFGLKVKYHVYSCAEVKIWSAVVEASSSNGQTSCHHHQ